MACDSVPGASVVIGHEIEEGEKRMHGAEVEGLDLFKAWMRT